MLVYIRHPARGERQRSFLVVIEIWSADPQADVLSCSYPIESSGKWHDHPYQTLIGIAVTSRTHDLHPSVPWMFTKNDQQGDRNLWGCITQNYGEDLPWRDETFSCDPRRFALPKDMLMHARKNNRSSVAT